MAENANRRLSREVEEAIQDYLGKIARRMKSSGSDAAESRAVLDDLETQIRAALAEKGPEPTWNDLASVLSKMDSPDKFSAGAESKRTLRPAVVFAGILLVVAAAAVASLGAAGAGAAWPGFWERLQHA